MNTIGIRLIEAGVRNLKDFGYKDVNEKNIFTDYVYAAFFKSMLEGTIEDAGKMPSAYRDETLLWCRDFLSRIEKEREKTP